MDKIWHRCDIKYHHKKGLASKDIHADMVATLGDIAPSYATVKESLDDDRCG